MSSEGSRARRAALARARLFVLHVVLVPHQQFARRLARVAVHLVQPVVHVAERLGVRDVVHHDDAVRPAIVGRRDRAEPLLAGRVPDLQFYRLAVHLYCFKPEIDADRRDVAFCKLVMERVAPEHPNFAYQFEWNADGASRGGRTPSTRLVSISQ